MRRIISGLVALTLALVVLGSVPTGIQTGGLSGGVIASHTALASPSLAHVGWEVVVAEM
jgi:hypothetical protein